MVEAPVYKVADVKVRYPLRGGGFDRGLDLGEETVGGKKIIGQEEVAQ